MTPMPMLGTDDYDSEILKKDKVPSYQILLSVLTDCLVIRSGGLLFQSLELDNTVSGLRF